VRTVQGIYLARCTVGLYQIIGHALGIQESLTSTPESGVEPLTEYTESRRLSHERYFFARNSKLIKAAKEHYGAVCQACTFEYRSKYGELGEGYIEVHHLDPLSERPELEWSDHLRTSIGSVTVLCADCHRMIHRKRPALSLQELRETIAKTGD
jgi:5-methylcytosine-specific restriction protein A